MHDGINVSDAFLLPFSSYYIGYKLLDSNDNASRLLVTMNSAEEIKNIPTNTNILRFKKVSVNCNELPYILCIGLFEWRCNWKGFHRGRKNFACHQFLSWGQNIRFSASFTQISIEFIINLSSTFIQVRTTTSWSF